MKSTEDLLRLRKEQIRDALVKEILDGWLQYVASLSEEEQIKVATLDGTELNGALRAAYRKAEAGKDGKGAQSLPAWKLTSPSQEAEREVRAARAEKAKADRREAFLLGVNPFLAPAAVAQGGGGFLYRNVGDPVTPAMVVGQNVYRGPQPMAPHVGILTRIFTMGAAGVIQGYVGANEMFAPQGQQIYCMSMCTNPDDTLGRSPRWKFACPTPVLQPVLPATIQAELNVSALQAGVLQGGDWSLQSNTGAIAGAAVVAFVCNGRADEHIFLTHIPLGPGFAFRKYQGEAYQCQWKVLDALTVTAYTQHCATYEMDI